MSEKGQKVLAEALDLPPLERAELIERLLSSFEFSGRDSIDAHWAGEVEDRIDAYERGDLSMVPAGEVFDKITRRCAF